MPPAASAAPPWHHESPTPHKLQALVQLRESINSCGAELHGASWVRTATIAASPLQHHEPRRRERGAGRTRGEGTRRGGRCLVRGLLEGVGAGLVVAGLVPVQVHHLDVDNLPPRAAAAKRLRAWHSPVASVWVSPPPLLRLARWRRGRAGAMRSAGRQRRRRLPRDAHAARRRRRRRRRAFDTGSRTFV